MGFIMENLSTVIVGLILLGIVALSIHSIVKMKKAGKSVLCGGSCGGCSGACGCRPRTLAKKSK